MYEEIRKGPEPKGIRFCVACSQEFKPDEEWFKEWSGDGSYAIGLHFGCSLQHGSMRRGIDYICGICGFRSVLKEEALMHVRSSHRIFNVAAASKLLR